MAAVDGERNVEAVEYDHFGGPEVLALRKCAAPRPGRGQVLVAVKATALNPKDLVVQSGRRPHRWIVGSRFPKRLGYDWAGQVVRVGRGVDGLAEGDALFGMIESWHGGACATQILANRSEFAHMPHSLSWQQAAAVPLAAQTALQGLRDFARARPGQRILINGASGGVGTFAVQIAKIMQCQVTAVTSGANAHWVRALGADAVIDYQTTALRAAGGHYDAFFDVFGNRSFSEIQPLLARRGRFVSTVPKLHVVRDAIFTRVSAQSASLVRVHSSADDLRTLAGWIDEGQLRVMVDRTFPLHAIADAQRYLGTRHARGKVVIVMPEGAAGH